MATQAQLNNQLSATSRAIVTLQRQLNSPSLTPQARAQIESSLQNLFVQEAQIRRELAAIDVANNPPNPQVPSDSEAPLRIDIFGVGDNTPNDDVVGQGPDAAAIQRIELPPAPPVVEVDVTPPPQGITGPVDGISPYGEQDDDFAPDAESTVSGITGPVDGISPYGEQDDEFDPDAERIRNSGPPPADNPYPDSDDAGLEDINTSDEEAAEAQALANQRTATLANARNQAALQAQQKTANQGDWRVRLRLAPGAQYLYDDPEGAGILEPLNSASGTGGVIFPYTPTIQTAYRANYSTYDLTHSNYRGYFYQNSYVDDIQLTATFTAQDTTEANYLLAVIHFFRSVTKMFYGANDKYAGTPPPLVYLQGLGEWQFNLHPCVVAQFNYNLPDDVDYIRARSPNSVGTNLLVRRSRQSAATNPFSSAIERLKNAGLRPGAVPSVPPVPTLGTNSPTYVPTKIDITLVLHPIQSREQVSQQFDLQSFANGQLLRGGFW